MEEEKKIDWKQIATDMYEVMHETRALIPDWGQARELIEWSLEVEEDYKKAIKP